VLTTHQSLPKQWLLSSNHKILSDGCRFGSRIREWGAFSHVPTSKSLPFVFFLLTFVLVVVGSELCDNFCPFFGEGPAYGAFTFGVPISYILWTSNEKGGRRLLGQERLF